MLSGVELMFIQTIPHFVRVVAPGTILVQATTVLLPAKTLDLIATSVIEGPTKVETVLPLEPSVHRALPRPDT